ncbi:hypothetical protein D3C74_452430 [compost metagenome]
MNNPAFSPPAVAAVITEGQYVFSRLMPFFPVNNWMMPIKSKLRKCRYIGTMSVLVGTRIVRITRIKSTLLPGKENRAKPYPASAQDMAVRSVVMVTNNNVFASRGR